MNLNNAVNIFAGVYTLSIALEILFSVRSHRGLYDFNDSIVNLVLGVLAVAIRLVTKGLWLALWLYLYQFAPFKIGNNGWSWLALFIANEFVYYWFHRLSHENRFLWAVHVNHHSSEKLNFTTAARVPLLNFIFHNIFWIPLVMIGFDPVMIFTVESVGFLFAFYQHTQLIGKLPVADWVLNTPAHHRVHHACNPEYRNKNYGNVLIVFDRLFGTFKAEDEKVKPVYGLEENLGTYNLLTVIFHEWIAIWKKKSIDIAQLERVLRGVVITALLLAATYHLIELFAVSGEVQTIRHTAFLVIDIVCAYGMKRPFPFFLPAFAAFTLQQYCSHGYDLVRAWVDESRVDWVSVGVLLVLPCGIWSLMKRGGKTRGNFSQGWPSSILRSHGVKKKLAG